MCFDSVSEEERRRWFWGSDFSLTPEVESQVRVWCLNRLREEKVYRECRRRKSEIGDGGEGRGLFGRFAGGIWPRGRRSVEVRWGGHYL